jgi:hypothetical protein
MSDPITSTCDMLSATILLSATIKAQRSKSNPSSKAKQAQPTSVRPVDGGLASVPFDGTYGARAFPAAAAFKDGSDSVCELEYCPLPPVCFADDEAAAAEAAKARGETLLCPPTENMPPCPEVCSDPPGVGLKRYPGIPGVFHCGFRGVVADCHPDGDHLQQECFYDEARQLVGGDHIDRLCAGTPNAYDAKEHPVWHVFSKGGILQEGLWGLAGTILHNDRARDEDANETDPPDIQ